MDMEANEFKRETAISNMVILENSGLSYQVKNSGTILLFRIPGKPAVDLYPTVNRWKLVGSKPQMMYGDASAFLAWYAKQLVPVEAAPGAHIFTNWYEVKAYAILNKKTVIPTKGGWFIK